jgi:transcriptional regulator with XRE-family HTH domain
MTTTHDTPDPAPWEGLRVLRKKDGHTIESLAQETDFTRQYVSLLERGHRRPTPNVIKALAEALNVPKSVLERTVPEQWRDQTEGAA